MKFGCDYIWNISHLYCGSRCKWIVIIAVNLLRWSLFTCIYYRSTMKYEIFHIYSHKALLLFTGNPVIFSVTTAVAIFFLAALPLNIAMIVIGEFKYYCSIALYFFWFCFSLKYNEAVSNSLPLHWKWFLIVVVTLETPAYRPPQRGVSLVLY